MQFISGDSLKIQIPRILSSLPFISLDYGREEKDVPFSLLAFCLSLNPPANYANKRMITESAEPRMGFRILLI